MQSNLQTDTTNTTNNEDAKSDKQINIDNLLLVNGHHLAFKENSHFIPPLDEEIKSIFSVPEFSYSDKGSKLIIIIVRNKFDQNDVIIVQQTNPNNLQINSNEEPHYNLLYPNYIAFLDELRVVKSWIINPPNENLQTLSTSKKESLAKLSKMYSDINIDTEFMRILLENTTILSQDINVAESILQGLSIKDIKNLRSISLQYSDMINKIFINVVTRTYPELKDISNEFLQDIDFISLYQKIRKYNTNNSQLINIADWAAGHSFPLLVALIDRGFIPTTKGANLASRKGLIDVIEFLSVLNPPVVPNTHGANSAAIYGHLNILLWLAGNRPTIKQLAEKHENLSLFRWVDRNMPTAMVDPDTPTILQDGSGIYFISKRYLSTLATLQKELYRLEQQGVASKDINLISQYPDIINFITQVNLQFNPFGNFGWNINPNVGNLNINNLNDNTNPQQLNDYLRNIPDLNWFADHGCSGKAGPISIINTDYYVDMNGEVIGLKILPSENTFEIVLKNNHTDVFLWMLSQNLVPHNGSEIIESALFKGNLVIVEELLKSPGLRNMYLNHISINAASITMKLLTKGQLSTLDWLLNLNVTNPGLISYNDNETKKFMISAIKSSNIETVKWLIIRNIKPTYISLLYAIVYGKYDIAEYFIENEGLSLSENERTPIHHFATKYGMNDRKFTVGEIIAIETILKGKLDALMWLEKKGYLSDVIGANYSLAEYYAIPLVIKNEINNQIEQDNLPIPLPANLVPPLQVHNDVAIQAEQQNDNIQEGNIQAEQQNDNIQEGNIQQVDRLLTEQTDSPLNAKTYHNILVWLAERNILPNEEIYRVIIKGDTNITKRLSERSKLKMIKQIYGMYLFLPNTKTANTTVRKNYLAILEWIVNKGAYPDSKGADNAVTINNYNMLELLAKQNILPTSKAFDLQLKKRVIDENMIQWLNNHNVLPTSEGANAVSNKNLTNWLDWLATKGILPDSEALDYQYTHNPNPDTVDWLRNKGIMPSGKTFDYYIGTGNQNMISQMKESGILPTVKGANNAVQTNNYEMLDWMEQRGILPDSHGVDIAIKNKNYVMLKILLDKNIIPSQKTVDELVQQMNYQILKILARKNILPSSQAMDRELLNELPNDTILYFLHSEGVKPSPHGVDGLILRRQYDQVYNALNSGVFPTDVGISHAVRNHDINILEMLYTKGIFPSAEVINEQINKQDKRMNSWFLTRDLAIDNDGVIMAVVNPQIDFTRSRSPIN